MFVEWTSHPLILYFPHLSKYFLEPLIRGSIQGIAMLCLVQPKVQADETNTKESLNTTASPALNPYIKYNGHFF